MFCDTRVPRPARACGARASGFGRVVRLTGRFLRGRAARSARLVHTQKVAGSNPALATAESVPLVGGSTHGGIRAPETARASGNRYRAERRASSNGQERQRNAGACPMLCSPLRPRIEGGSPSGSATKENNTHAAPWANPRGAEYALSQRQELLGLSGAHGGLVGTRVTRTRSGAETSAVKRTVRNESTVWRSLVARRGSANYAEVAGSNPVTVPDMRGVAQLETHHGSELENVIDAGSNLAAPPTSSRREATKVRAQQQESVGRPASEDDCASGSSAGQPELVAYRVRLS